MKTNRNKGFRGRFDFIGGCLLDGTINGYKIIEQNDTPGLGTKVSENKFSEQFKGMNPGSGSFKVRQDGGEIDAVTSATISSRAVIDAIKRGYDNYTRFSSMAGNEEK